MKRLLMLLIIVMGLIVHKSNAMNRDCSGAGTSDDEPDNRLFKVEFHFHLPGGKNVPQSDWSLPEIVQKFTCNKCLQEHLNKLDQQQTLRASMHALKENLHSLHWAVRLKKYDFLETLIDANADIETLSRNSYKTALDLAIEMKDMVSVELLTMVMLKKQSSLLLQACNTAIKIHFDLINVIATIFRIHSDLPFRSLQDITEWLNALREEAKINAQRDAQAGLNTETNFRLSGMKKSDSQELKEAGWDDHTEELVAAGWRPNTSPKPAQTGTSA